MWLTVTLLVSVCLSPTLALNNGLARTPPMGWLAWERFRCNTDCVNDPENCISQNLFMQMADLVVSEGYLDVGYQYVNVDDCWLAKTRSPAGFLQPDPDRFPSGIKALADYIHGKGLHFGIYEDYGNYTCAGYPGIIDDMERDAYTFAQWGVDYVKLDGCYSSPSTMDQGYPEFGYYLNKTGRPMVYSCSWPVYQIYSGITPNWTSIATTCNLWRNYDDIQDSWASVTSIIDYFGDNQDTLIQTAGPGHWNDPDMLIVGDFGLSYDQCKTQFSMWAIMASPLLMSVDLRTIRPEYKAILQNTKVIAIDQDPLGLQGKRIYKDQGIEIWTRPVSPVADSDYSYAVAFTNRRTDGTPSQVSVTVSELGLNHAAGYTAEDLFTGEVYESLVPSSKISVDVNPSGVVILKFTAVESSLLSFNTFNNQQPELVHNSLHQSARNVIPRQQNQQFAQYVPTHNNAQHAFRTPNNQFPQFLGKK